MPVIHGRRAHSPLGIGLILVTAACSTVPSVPGVPTPSSVPSLPGRSASPSLPSCPASATPNRRGVIPGPVGVAGNGLIAYSHNGAIYVGDPQTGETMEVVSGDDLINPIFSPDGSHIAYLRGDPAVEAAILVVEADGSAPRIVVPDSRPPVGPFAWTPDSRSLVVEVDSPPFAFPHGDGELSLFDVTGRAEPLQLTPPLPRTPGRTYFNPSAQIAPMFRPPAGDLILAEASNRLIAVDADLEHETPIGEEALESYELGYLINPTWSPNGNAIAFGSERSFEFFVLDLASGKVRELGHAGWPSFSPDGTKLAVERATAAVSSQASPTAVIAIIDIDSGVERVLRSSEVELKQGANVHTITFNQAHTWYYEGWSWSPDGRSILMLENYNTRLRVVDVDADEACELPWVADSAPSWQRVLIDGDG